jgi:tetratricopeptide (TPR) repeat protein
MKCIVISLIVLLAVVPAEARTVELTIHPAKSPKSEQKYQLLVKSDEQSDVDAAPLYEKAVQSLPGDLKMDEIEQWLKIPPDELPLKKVQSTLQQIEPALELLEQAAKCKRCEWPYLYDDELSENLSVQRRLLFCLALKIRFQVARDRYDDAIGTIQTGFAMARHLGDDSTLVRGMVGIGMAAYMCRQIEQFVQRPDAPNLYQALLDLPQPLIDLTRKMEWEEPDIKGKVYLLMNRLDRHIAVLQCIEAIRLYAGSHNGKFPKKLGDVTNIKIPVNPITQKQFSYRNTGSESVIELESIEGRYAVRYELKLK